jgi:L,D-transpeptidase ErfK/SrfK
MVSAKTGVNWRVIAKENGLDPKTLLEPGTTLRINTMRIVPKTVDNGIVINIPDKTLYLFKNGKLQRTYPVGLGMTKRKDLSSWETPTGKFTIISKVKDPNWYIPYSIQQKLKKEGKDFLPIVPPGPGNPLGKYAICTNIGGILIHGTIYPESVNSFRSHGCVRLLPRDMEKFFNTIPVNTSGEIIYKPVKVAVLDNGRVFLEVHSDAYNKVRDLEAKAKRLLEEKKAMDRVDWNKVKALLKNGNGLVEEVTNRM